MNARKVLLFASLLLIAGATQADMFTPSHSCRKPYKPYKFTSEWQFNQFKSDVEEFKRCISEFVEEQNEAAENHREAAEEAIDEWNRYVQYELN